MPALIDEKGRILGKINIIDLFFLLALLAFIVLGGYYLSKLYLVATYTEQPTPVVYRLRGQPYNIWSSLAAGDRLIDRVGEDSSRISAVILLHQESDGRADLLLVANMSARKQPNGKIVFDGITLISGAGLRLRTRSVDFWADVVSVGDDKIAYALPVRPAVVVFRAKNMPYPVWSSLAAGGSLVDRAMDDSSRILDVIPVRMDANGIYDVVVVANVSA